MRLWTINAVPFALTKSMSAWDAHSVMVWRACILFQQTAARVPHSAVISVHPFTQGHAHGFPPQLIAAPTQGAVSGRTAEPAAQATHRQSTLRPVQDCQTPRLIGCMFASAQTSFGTQHVLWHLTLDASN